jgi:hypothetical protein
MNTAQIGKSRFTKWYKIFSISLALIMIFGTFGPASQNHALAQTTAQPSKNVAVIDSVTVRNGGSFPTTTTGPTGSFLDFNFFILPRINVSLAALGPGGVCGADGCDTVLLNVASSGMACNINNLTAQQKADLISFVNLGRKLIIYDSECVAQDYSWLPYPFTTVNPGALGAQGTLTIVEENTLSSGDSTSTYFINAVMLGTSTDAVGDMNVMTTYDPNWFLDMSGTNAIGYTGPVHTYASLPLGTDAGLIIYNGLDVDYMNTSTIPTSATAAGNLAKIWLQELQQVFNPSDLPGTNPVIGIFLTPETATLNIGTNHTVTATVIDLLGLPQENIEVIFSVDSGPNVGTSGSCSVNTDCTTDANGHVAFTYTGDGGIGIDEIKGCFINAIGQQICSSLVTAEWTQNTDQLIEYFALGDSIASGHGLTDDGTECRRSYLYSYPIQVYQMLSTTYSSIHFPPTQFLACSGARAIFDKKEVNKDDYKWLGNQIEDTVAKINEIPSDTPIIVSISIGMNDLGWTDPTTILIHIRDDYSTFYNWVEKTSSEAATELREQLEILLNNNPNVHVVINTYHNPMNYTSHFFTLANKNKASILTSCNDLWGTLECYERTELAVETLNNTLILEAFAPIANLYPDQIDIAAFMHAAFSGHESPRYTCGTSLPGIEDTWIQYPGDPNSNAIYPSVLKKIQPFVGLYGDCLHPNRKGAEAYAIAVSDAFRNLLGP